MTAADHLLRDHRRRRMFLAFSRHPADALVLEVGLGGNYDATNVVDKPAMTVITPVGLDHQEFLGDDTRRHRGAKRPASSRRACRWSWARRTIRRRDVILRTADRLGAPAFVFGQDFFGRTGTWPHGLSGRDGPARSAAAETVGPPPDRERRASPSRRCAMRAAAGARGRGDRARACAPSNGRRGCSG